MNECGIGKGKQVTQQGGATFLTAVILLVVTTMIAIFAGNITRNLDKEVANQSRNKEAFMAAEAGLEFGMSYLKQNDSTIIASPSSGYINYSNSSTTSISLANGSTFSVVYTNPVASNYTLILITSTGTSADGSSTRVVQQMIQSNSVLGNYGTAAMASQGAVTISGNGVITNTTSNQTVQSASTVSFSGNGKTTISSGTGSNSSHIGSDVSQNNTTLSSESQNTFFAGYFGTTSTSAIQSEMGNVYTNSSSTDYSSTLNGMTNTSIWINQTSGSTATISGNTVIGSAANPVLLIVDGNLSISGNVTIYGFVYILGSSTVDTVSGNVLITGGLASTGAFNMSGNSSLTYSPTVLTSLTSSSTLRNYGKVTGSWKDF